MPKVAALITASGGIGSHFVLHKLQGHKDIVSLKESAFRSQEGTSKKGDLKRFLSKKILPDLNPEQLHPKKSILESQWIILNKPPLKMVNYHRNFHPDIPVLYIFRNPVSFYYTWIKKWKEYGNRRYGRILSDQEVFEWFKNTFMSSLFELAQNFNTQRDNIISFEHFFEHTDTELERIFRCLDVEVVKNRDLKIMDKCNICGTEKVVRKKTTVRKEREEEVIYCQRHGASLGPGEYNYIRKEQPSFLNKWKQNVDAKEVSKKFEKLFSKDIVEYYTEEKYIKDKNREQFDEIIFNFLEGLRV